MSARSQPDSASGTRGCGGGCSVCGGRGLPDAPAGSPCGSRLALSAALVFVLPLALAAYGAARAGSDGYHQPLGALAGFVLGILVAQAVLRLLRKRWGVAA